MEGDEVLKVSEMCMCFYESVENLVMYVSGVKILIQRVFFLFFVLTNQ